MKEINLKPTMNLFCIWLVDLLLLSYIMPLSQSNAEEVGKVSGVLGRNYRLSAICDDFEDPDWKYDHQNYISSNGFWRGPHGRKGFDPSDRGDPAILERVTPPRGGRSGSTGALKIGTDIPDDDNVPIQDDLLTAEFEKLGRKLTRADQPVFIVYVWLPPFDQWGDYYKFGFRQEFIRENSSAYYYASIFLVYNRGKASFVFRIHPKLGEKAIEVIGLPINQSGWWTLAIAFDEKGIDYYYARPGADIPTEDDKIFDTREFRGKEDACGPSMDKVNYSFFSLMYPPNSDKSPRFIIDDYEVWVVKDSNK